LEQAVTATERYNALVDLHKMLDRLSALAPLYDGIESIEQAGNSAFSLSDDAVYDLSGRKASVDKKGIHIKNHKKIMR